MSRTKAWFIFIFAAAALAGVAALRSSPQRPTREPLPSAAAPNSSEEEKNPVFERILPVHDRVEATRVEVAGDSIASPPVQGSSPAPASPRPEEGRHPGSDVDDATVRRLHGDEPLTVDHPHMKAAREVQERHTDWLMAHPAVVGTALGLNDEGMVAIVVYTKVDAPGLPASLEGVPVAVFRSGEFLARNRQEVKTRDDVSPRGHSSAPGAGRYERPVPIGVSTGHPSITAGTIGCRVRRGDSLYALSNNHVYANENRANLGDPVIQPGTYDHGVSPADDIGSLAEYVPIVFGTSSSVKNKVDAALAATDGTKVGRSTPQGVGYGTPRSTPVTPALRMRVQKVGRTTGHTTGNISALNATVHVGYDRGVARFVGQIVIQPGSFSAGGDSGSLIVNTSRQPVGLLFAGSSSSTIANPIADVLAAFPGISIDGE